MVLLPEITSDVQDLLSFTPLQYMLLALKETPALGMVYTDTIDSPETCIVRIGRLLFCGGQPDKACIAFMEAKILTVEIYEKYGVFYFFYPNEGWKTKLAKSYPQGIVYERTLYQAGRAPAQSVGLPGLMPIEASMFDGAVKNQTMIQEELGTYAGVTDFLERGIGYTVLLEEAVQGFCTSEYQSKNALAIGIEVTEAFRHKGYAKAMTAAFLREAVNRGFTVYWESRKDNAASVATALACGFFHISDYPVFFVDLSHLHRQKKAPREETVYKAIRSYLPGATAVTRVEEGMSTYVYRVSDETKRYYIRLLPEDASFGAEVLAHRYMQDKGIPIPEIIAFAEKEPITGFSMMLAREIPGVSMAQQWPDNAPAILRAAGYQLALLHTIPVEGFGWINRESPNVLRGEKESFTAYFTEYLQNDLTALFDYDLTPGEQEAVCRCMEEAVLLLHIESAVLVHGDFDSTHIFHADGKFTGFIDFGEIRGNHPFFDLGMFALHDDSPNRKALANLLAGYKTHTPLSQTDLRGIELMALFIALRFAGKKVETRFHDYWLQVLKKQLQELW